MAKPSIIRYGEYRIVKLAPQTLHITLTTLVEDDGFQEREINDFL